MGKTVYQVAEGDRHRDLQSLYQDRNVMPRALLPNVRMERADGSVAMETNALGLLGPDHIAERSIVFWGDSFGFRFHPFDNQRGWVEMVGDYLPGWQILSGCMPGVGEDEILSVCVTTNRRAALGINVISIGFHGGEDRVRDQLERTVRAVPSPVLMTLPTSLRPDVIENFASLLREGDSVTGFRFWGDWEPTAERVGHLYAKILTRNAIVRDVASATGAPLVDLFDQIPHTTALFFDAGHLRLSAYRLVAVLMATGIRSALPSTLRLLSRRLKFRNPGERVDLRSEISIGA